MTHNEHTPVEHTQHTERTGDTERTVYPLALYTADLDDANALAAEAAHIRNELDLLKEKLRTTRRHTTATPGDTSREDLRAYRDYLKSRLRAIHHQQNTLCRRCHGTGRYEDIHRTYRTCPTCGRLNPDHDTNYY